MATTTTKNAYTTLTFFHWRQIDGVAGMSKKEYANLTNKEYFYIKLKIYHR